MTDLPDWTTQQQAGGIRYIGSVSVTIGGGGSGGGSLNVSLLPLDRSIIVVCPGRGAITTTTVSVLTNDPGVSPALFSTSAGVSADPQPVNAYVSPAITSLWQVAVDMTGPASGPFVFYVFVDSSVTHVAVDPGAASIPVGITSPATGQANALNSLPVVIASDQPPVSVVDYLGTAGLRVAIAGVGNGSPAFTLGGIATVLAAAGGVTVHVVRMRLVAGAAASMGTVQGIWTDTNGTQLGQCGLSGSVLADDVDYGAQGLALTMGVGVRVQSQGSVAGQTMGAFLHYWTS